MIIYVLMGEVRNQISRKEKGKPRGDNKMIVYFR